MTNVLRFIPNEADNLHCLQACYQMVYEAFTADKLTLREAETRTNFVQGKPTWPFAAILSLMDAGLKVTYLENFPINVFIKDPKKALMIQYGDKKIVKGMLDVLNFDVEVELARKCFKHQNMNFQQYSPDIEDIDNLLKTDSLLIANVNYWKLLGKDEYAGHFVIIEKKLGNVLTLQNPGLPPVQNQIVTVEQFIEAWHYPNKGASNIIAVKR